MTDYQRKPPTWFWIIASLFFVWNLLGVFNFFQNVFISDEVLKTFSQNQRKMYEDSFMWTFFALSVFAGLGGSIGLLLKKKIAFSLFILSMIGVVFHLLITILTDVFDTSIALFSSILILTGLFEIWFVYWTNSKQWIE